MLLDKGDRIVMIGDSITNADRCLEDDTDQGLGKGYVSMSAALFKSAAPGMGIRVINRGIGGNTIRDLCNRWQKDVLDLKPNWVSVCIGVNDVWQHFIKDHDPATLIGPDEFRDMLTDLVKQTMPLVKGMVLMTPFFLGDDADDPKRIKMLEYCELVRQVASGFRRAVFVDLQEPLDAMMQQIGEKELSADRVHPYACGHMAVARAFLGAIGFEC
ncbi:MAG: SGNH/GDSL hydrolase family protein [Planctomycetes bacterium]|jgi:lysophospholipase L1-like esterase|nr:SGNH/GDSL hydrolase family protein [Planctomycetota bacterium]